MRHFATYFYALAALLVSVAVYFDAPRTLGFIDEETDARAVEREWKRLRLRSRLLLAAMRYQEQKTPLHRPAISQRLEGELVEVQL